MRRILFLILCIPVFAPPAMGSIEIFANGHKYESMQAYKASEKIVITKLSTTQATLDNQQEDYIRKEAQKLGINVDFGRLKTFQAGDVRHDRSFHQEISNENIHKLFVLSVENGVVDALQDFYKTRGKSDFEISHRISLDQLQDAIQQAVARSQVPKLLISTPGKVRIMALTTDEAKKLDY